MLTVVILTLQDDGEYALFTELLRLSAHVAQISDLSGASNNVLLLVGRVWL
jgi:hypothetical protein